MLRSALRIAAAVILMLVLAFAAMAFWGRAFGDRVYLRNLSSCEIFVVSEHDGMRVEPGATKLLKPGWMDRTPSTAIGPTHAPSLSLSGIHFAAGGKLSVRGRPDLLAPPAWIEQEWFGSRVV